MSPKPRSYAVAGLFALASVGALATTAQAAPVQQAYQCTFPTIGLKPIDVTIDAALPFYASPDTGISGDQLTITTSVASDVAADLETVGIGGSNSTVSGNGIARWTEYRGSDIRFINVPLDTTSGSPLSGTLAGTIPTQVFTGFGSPGDPVVISQTGFSLNLRVTTSNGTVLTIAPVPGSIDSDGDPTTFDVYCAPQPGVSTVIGSIQTVVLDPTPTPTLSPTPTPTATPPSPTPTMIVGTPTPIPTPTPTLSPTPTATPQPTVKPIPSLTPSPTPIITPAPSDSAPISYSFGLAGNATLKTLTKGSLPLTGRVDAKIALQTGAFSGDLALNPTSGSLTALGFLPVSATVNLVPTAPVTGTFIRATQGLTATAKVRIKLPTIKTVGIPLAGGANCQASQISTIPLSSVGKFDVLAGGTLAGTFSISNLTGCGVLTGLVSPLTAGNGNAISLKLTGEGGTV